LEAFHNAESNQRETVLATLKQTLERYFDEDVNQRERDITQIEERVKNLREQLERRREKKQEIIDLQIKVAQNEAEGLGFFGMPGVPEPGPSPVARSRPANQRAIIEERIERTRSEANQEGRGPNPQPARPPQAGTLNDLFGPAPVPANPPLPAGPPR
jgi:DNA repair exonuclease SbcCD ATPase subunit